MQLICELLVIMAPLPTQIAAIASPLQARHLTPVEGAPAPVVTPCVKVCIVDGESGLCLGCYRTLGEVARWSSLSETQRSDVMADLPGRRSRIRPEKLGLVSG
jgi:predicted Fe-S protein YdhL (DUF1289 family)